VDDRFHRLVAEALDGLPGWVHDRLDNVEVIVEEDAGNPNLLGLYEGVPLTNRAHYTWALPDRITLFRRAIERVAGRDDEALRRLVADTVIHEVAHHFGISDERLRDLGRD
jgi:predicted Zn-dependent protease with MMP-like domain